ncbi:MAG: cytochrome c [Chitinophagaceae bacterium]|nr:cytochrome c [Chitinophagaceae bacterium]
MKKHFFYITICCILLTSAIPLSLAQQEQIDPGKSVYEKHCLSCHQADGSGVPGMNPPLSKVSWVTGNKTKLIQTVLNGISTPLEIDGEVYHNPMPSHDLLSNQQIADVLTYIRSHFGNTANAVTAAEVKKVRGK